MHARWNNAKTGVNFTDFLTACDIYKSNKGIEPPIRNKSGNIEITNPPQVVSTDLLGSVTSTARRNDPFMTKYSD